MKIVTVVGARPQFIKASSVSRAMKLFPHFEEIVIHTGQHYDDNVSGIFFRELEIPSPKYNLGIGNLTHGAMTARQLEGIESVLFDERPELVLVYGDTNSTLAGALAASKLQIPVAHVEAGLRSNNLRMPEEINRRLTDHVSTWLFTPTDNATDNLIREGIDQQSIWKVGDVMYDVAVFFGETARQNSTILGQLKLSPGHYVVSTLHRAETTNQPERLRAFFEALRWLSREFPIVLPLHPRTRKALREFDYGLDNGITILDPVGYLDMTKLVSNARLVVTDSGGLQKEAFFHGVMCVTLRDETEWTELVASGWNILPATLDLGGVVSALTQALRRAPAERPVLYGTGHAASELLRILESKHA